MMCLFQIEDNTKTQRSRGTRSSGNSGPGQIPNTTDEQK